MKTEKSGSGSRRRLTSALAVGLVVVTALATPADAATRTWTDEGGHPHYWSNPSHWTDGVAPVAGDDLVFSGSSSANDFADGTSFRSLSFTMNHGAGGNRLRLREGIQAEVPPGHSVALQMPIALDADQTWATGAAYFQHDNTLDLAGHVLTVDTATQAVPAWIVGDGLIRKAGVGRLFVREGVTSDSRLEVLAGVVDMQSTVWSAPIRVSAGTLLGVGAANRVTVGRGTIAAVGPRGGGFDDASRFTIADLTLSPEATVRIALNSDKTSQLATGRVDLAGARLDVGVGTTRPLGSTMKILDNTGSLPVAGTFVGLPEGAYFDTELGRQDGRGLRITYRGGDGNDAVLTVVEPPPAPRSGYSMLAADGRVYSFGDAPFLGDAPVASPAADIETVRSGRGYWVVDTDGHVYAFGEAPYLGGAPQLVGERVTSMSSTPSGNGYWLFTSKGRVMAFGDAAFHGDMATTPLNGPVLDSVPTPTGGGYYMVASDGGIFTFGDAEFAGSMGGVPLNAPVESLVPDNDGDGYWLVASDGGIFSFASQFYGSMGGTRLNRPVTGMVGFDHGYLMVAADGGIFTFGGAMFHGSLGSSPPAQPIVAVSPLA